MTCAHPPFLLCLSCTGAPDTPQMAGFSRTYSAISGRPDPAPVNRASITAARLNGAARLLDGDCHEAAR